MKVFKFLPPYQPNGKTTYPDKKRSGVYIIKENGKITYIGNSSKNVIYKTMYRHFQRWNHRGQEVITYASKLKSNKYTVRVIYTTPNQAIRLERYLILKYRPRDNENQYLNYELDLKDKKTYEVYVSTEPEEDCPY